MFWRKPAVEYTDLTRSKEPFDGWGWRIFEIHAATKSGQRILIWAGHTVVRDARRTAQGFADEGIGAHVQETERFRNSGLRDDDVITEIILSPALA